MRASAPPSLIFLNVHDQVEVTPNNDLIALKMLQIVGNVSEKLRSIFIWCVKVTEGETCAICVYVTNDKATVRV